MSKNEADILEKQVMDKGTGSLTDAPSASEDALRLAQLGHEQELRRQYSLVSLIALCLCLGATWEALSTVVATALVNGGAPCVFYNYILSTIFSLCVAASLSEIASIYPTAGGQYHWVAALAPSSICSSASFMTGWVSIGGQVVLTASAAFAAGLETQSLIIINDSSYIPERWQGLLFYWAVLIYALVLNVWGHRTLPWHNYVSGIIHVLGFVIVVVVLGVMAPKNTSSFVFKEVTNQSGWSDDGVSWLVGLLSTVYPFLGYDAACHLAEEMPHASRNVPIAMVGSVGINGFLGLVYAIILLYSAGPLETLVTTRTGYPFMQIFLDATKSEVGTTLLSLLIILVAGAATVAGTTSTSRTLWAFARDRSTPFDKQLSKVNQRYEVPVYAVVVTVVLQMLLGFIYLGNTTAFNAILSMAIIGMYSSYAFPIIAMLFSRKRLQSVNAFGPFRLGRVAGPMLNVISLIWIIVVVVFSAFPSVMPVTAQNMNYSTVVMAGWILLGGLYYVIWGKKKYQVPNVDMAVLDGARDSVY
ncbi:hypothetical protein FVEN_g4431 [Fusarium venenatum]|uniref:Amino acid permease/ SLC12A domain-containing protein n=1 Tax=Fusarium venenatum TaxID=56646 RepID=A0A2L2T892_9HYPO|nr:uncharacterized protein FVRRES_02680 [Fusarium venenatum]KAG8357838.1 hypothetical protein FVEN_g4431 [Fusarium venenatum]KAH7004233.1 amino acid/polyamine transporter I [Fusarium venenatum]CEI66168.1 unnamed protein product [Fusarium venenatum]